MRYPFLSDKNYCDNDSTDSCLALKRQKNSQCHICLTSLTPFHLILIIPPKI